MSRGSVLPEGMTLTGEIRGQGDLVIAGAVEGPIAIDGHLTIEASGSVRGEVKARALVLRGTLAGPAIADETIRLEPGARMVGDARAERVSVIEGAMLRGRITMTGAVGAARRSSAGQVGAPSSAGTSAAPVAARAGAPSAVASTAPGAEGLAPIARPRAGVLIAERDREREDDDAEIDGRPTGRFARRGGGAKAAPASPPEPATEGARARGAGRAAGPPQPVIPGVGRQRARRKDGGSS